MTDTRPLPPGTRLVPDPAVRSIADGSVLMGGVPLAVIRLSPAGAETVRGWFGGRPVGTGAGRQRLARRLLDTGIAHPRRATVTAVEPTDRGDDPGSPAATSMDDVTVVIPVKDDPDGLRSTLASLGFAVESLGGTEGAAEPAIAVIVVDDGSSPPIAVPDNIGDAVGDAVGDSEVGLIRRPVAGGPGRARQEALERVETRLVAFVDAGVTVDADALRRLARHFQDPDIVAVAPRVESVPTRGPVGRYDRHRSPLDLGPTESAVGIGRIVPYVPTACLVVRVDALVDTGGFDPDLRYGEDVDLVWRLDRHGTVRYDPSVTVRHPPRSGLAAMVNQRMAYGSAAAPLAERHGAAVAPARTSPWTVAVTVLLVVGRPVTAALTAAWTVFALRRKLSFLPDATAESAVLVAKGHWYGGWSLFTAAVRTWLPPIALFGLSVRRARRRVVLVLAVGWARRLLDGDGTASDRLLDLVVGAVDDTAYCAGVWRGALARRSLRALLPDLVNWPPRGDDPSTERS